MSPVISSIHQLPLADVTRLSRTESKTQQFGELLETAIERLQNSQTTAKQAVEGYLAGEGEELHSTILATQRAELEMELFLQVRNKVMQAYQEIMRMQI